MKTKLHAWRILFVGLAVACLALVAWIAYAAAPGSDSGYHLIKKASLGGEGFWDYLALDAPSRRLFISRGTHVMVVNADSYEIVGDIPDTEGVHGIAFAPEFGRGFTSNGRANTVTIFDLETLRPVGSVKTGQNPDAILYDPASKRVFTFNGRSGDATAIDASAGTVAGTIALNGKPEFATADGTGHVYVNLEDKSELLAFDSRALTVANRWPLAPCEGPSGMAIDTEHSRLFIGCSNKTMAIVDAKSGKVVAAEPIGDHVDANRFDAATGLAFASCGDGTLTVVRENTPDQYTVLENVATQRGARTMEIDPKTHNVFLVTAEFGPSAAATSENPRPRSSMVPGSFALLVFGR
jgi:hypothetical protein